jgi:NADH-quinone oxidoreductase subunit C
MDALVSSLGAMVLASKEEHGEIVLTVARDSIEDALRRLRDNHEYQQLMEIAGVDYPARADRFEVVYMLLSVTQNHRILVKCTASESTPVPTVTTLWPVAGWLEREVFDMYGVLFAGNTDLRRILTDYGFEGHPQRKDFPLTGYTELRYSEDEKRVVYEPVELPQDFRRFDFMSPWEGANYVLPGDEKAVPAPPAPQPKPVVNSDGKTDSKAPETNGASPVDQPKTTETPAQTGAGKATDKKAAKKVAPTARNRGKSAQGEGDPAPVTSTTPEPGAPEPTENRPARKPRKAAARDTRPATETKPKRPRKPKGDGA